MRRLTLPLAAALAAQGKRVLVVSEKAAALDTVQQRLTEAGLGNYLLALHSDLVGRLLDRQRHHARHAILQSAPRDRLQGVCLRLP